MLIRWILKLVASPGDRRWLSFIFSTKAVHRWRDGRTVGTIFCDCASGRAIISKLWINNHKKFKNYGSARMRADRWHEGAALMNCQIGKKAHYVLFKIERIWSWCRQIWHQNTSLARKSPFFAKKKTSLACKSWIFYKKFGQKNSQKTSQKSDHKNDQKFQNLFWKKVPRAVHTAFFRIFEHEFEHEFEDEFEDEFEHEIER